MKNIKLIVGLSNPVYKYERTRHNAGAWLVRKIADIYHLKFKNKFLGNFSTLIISNNTIRLLIPNVFMNVNGESVYLLSKFYNIMLSNILIVHDELDLLPGQVKFKCSTGHGGHNGIRSILNKFQGKKNFYKLSIGIGRPFKKNEVATFVLSQPKPSEQILINQSINVAIYDLIQSIII